MRKLNFTDKQIEDVKKAMPLLNAIIFRNDVFIDENINIPDGWMSNLQYVIYAIKDIDVENYKISRPENIEYFKNPNGLSAIEFNEHQINYAKELIELLKAVVDRRTILVNEENLMLNLSNMLHLEFINIKQYTISNESKCQPYEDIKEAMNAIGNDLIKRNIEILREIYDKHIAYNKEITNETKIKE